MNCDSNSVKVAAVLPSAFGNNSVDLTYKSYVCLSFTFIVTEIG